MNISICLHKGTIYIPTSYRVIRDGYHFQHSPIEVAPVGQIQHLKRAIQIGAARGNPPISGEEVRRLRAAKKGTVLGAAGARSWKKFDREITGLLSMAEEDGLYKIRVKKPMESHGWHEDKEKARNFPAGTDVEEVIDRLVDLIQERARAVGVSIP
jgi:hypothetical protein